MNCFVIGISFNTLYVLVQDFYSNQLKMYCFGFNTLYVLVQGSSSSTKYKTY
uniref:hypothetical protein n=1 Tax=Aliarcobacter butzleri TaxID=28197 RepID=UPI00396A59F9